jgi:hypothetical protein
MLDIIGRVRAIVLTPETEWLAIEREKEELSVLFLRYVAVLAAIPAVALFVGASLIGGYTPMSLAAIDAAVFYVSSFVLIYGVAYVANLLAPKFDARRDFSRALRLTIYAYTPVWLAGIFLLVPGLSFLNILGLYGVYVLWLGLPVMMGVSSGGIGPYAAAIAATALVLELLLRAALAMI